MASAKTSKSAVRPSVVETRAALCVTVLAGGPSGERAVSLESGRAVTEALRAAGHDAEMMDISPDNLTALAKQVDCVFVALHGTFGEDGEVQQILDRRKLAYTGSDPAACALAIDKAKAKQVFMKAGIPTPRFDVATATNLREALACWSLPLVIKPVREGSSLYCKIVREFDHLRPAADEVLARYGSCLVEEFIPGMELTVGILGDQALPVIEIRTPRDFYDYAAKYEDDRTEYRFDVALPAEMLASIQQTSLAAHRALGLRDFSRVDWRVDPSTMKGYVLEVNASPGMTSHSLVPKAAAQAGLTMPQLCDQLVRMAQRHRTDGA